MDVAVITVGDEILAGETINTNAAWLGRELRDTGATVTRMTVVPDDVAVIARIVNEYRAEFDAVVVTGGLGPTHDDVTMEGVAAAFGTHLAADDDVEAWLEADGYSAEDLAPKTTHIPATAAMLENPEGVAPGCVIDSSYVLPGVPSEMKAMFETIREAFDGAAVYTKTVPAAEAESQLLERISRVRDEFDVEVGSYPGKYVRLKVHGEDESAVERAADWLHERVESPESVDDGDSTQ